MKPGDILLVRFPFTNLELEKKRPALLLRQTQHTKDISLFTIAMVTSKIEGFKLDGDILLSEWEEAKLLHPSLIRLSKMATVEKELVQDTLGHLSARDLKEVKRQFQKHFHYWI